VRLTLRTTATGGRLDDDAVLRAAYQEHAAELLGFAARSLHDEGLAEEAVQETFVRAWRAAGSFDSGLGSLRTWLYAICRNVVIDLSRARSRRPRVGLPAEQADEPVTEAALERLLVSFQVEEALRRLTEPHRTALVEVYLRGRPAREVGAALGIPEATVRTRVFYGLKALRLVLDEMGWVDEQ
jgi:RNA polymerase sigma-70 factor (ECF subfamily)